MSTHRFVVWNECLDICHIEDMAFDVCVALESLVPNPTYHVVVSEELEEIS